MRHVFLACIAAIAMHAVAEEPSIELNEMALSTVIEHEAKAGMFNGDHRLFLTVNDKDPSERLLARIEHLGRTFEPGSKFTKDGGLHYKMSNLGVMQNNSMKIKLACAVCMSESTFTLELSAGNWQIVGARHRMSQVTEAPEVREGVAHNGYPAATPNLAPERDGLSRSLLCCRKARTDSTTPQRGC